MRSNNNSKLKAFVRFDGSGRIIPSSLIVQAFKPKVGNYKQINSKECCLNNECAPPVYGGDWIVYGTEEVEGGLIYNIATNPYENFIMQAQLLNCETGERFYEIITIGPENGYEYGWFIPTAILDQSCNFYVRHVCGTDFYSEWALFD